MNLVVTDLFKSKSSLLLHAERAAELITWLRSKSRILAHLPLSVIRPNLTRWTAHYMAYRRLLLLYPPLMQLILDDIRRSEETKVLVSGDNKAREKAMEMVQIMNSPHFWHGIAL